MIGFEEEKALELEGAHNDLVHLSAHLPEENKEDLAELITKFPPAPKNAKTSSYLD